MIIFFMSHDALLFQANLQNRFWVDAILIATCLTNRNPTPVLLGKYHMKCCLMLNHPMLT